MAVIDSYSESNQDDLYGLNNSENGVEVGQSFEASGNFILSSVQFYLKKTGTPTGNAYAIIYAHTGTYGTSSLPTGSALATSDAFDPDSVGGTFGLAEFTFSGAEQISLISGTKYVVIIQHNNGTISDGLDVGTDSSSPSYGGNAIDSDGAVPPGEYYANSGVDLCFYINGDIAPAEISVNDSISVSESIGVLTSDLGISKVETVSISEYIEMYSGILIELSVNDSISLTESISGEIKTDYFISVNDTITLVENTSEEIKTDRFISVNDTIVVYEYLTVDVWNMAGTDAIFGPKAPVSTLEATSNLIGELDSNAPTAEGTGLCGAILSKKAGVAVCTGEASFSEIATLESKFPTPSLEALCGSIFEGTSPVAECDAESYSNYCEVDVYAPTGRGEGTAFTSYPATLDKKSPFPIMVATARTEYTVLDAIAPVWMGPVIIASAGSYNYLDKKAPVGKVIFGDMTGYVNSTVLDATSPTGTMSEDTGVEDTDPAIASYSDRFTDYTLGYSR
jgi:hypothetical protein